MKKLLISLLSCLFIASAMAQTSSVAPTSLEIQTKNAVLLYNYTAYYRVHGDTQNYKYHIRIPIYLNTPRNTTIKYNWYPTKMVFGEKVRTKDEPYLTIEGTYVDGRLSTHTFSKDPNRVIIIKWSDDGEITSINDYSSSGEFWRSTTLSDFWKYYWQKYKWEEHKSVWARAKGYDTSISIRNFVLESTFKRSDYISIEVLVISDGMLCREKVYSRFYRGIGDRSKRWHTDEDIEVLCKIMPDGRLNIDGMFDFNDSAGCDYFEL